MVSVSGACQLRAGTPSVHSLQSPRLPLTELRALEPKTYFLAIKTRGTWKEGMTGHMSPIASLVAQHRLTGKEFFHEKPADQPLPLLLPCLPTLFASPVPAFW